MPVNPKSCRLCGKTYYISYGGGVCGPEGCSRQGRRQLPLVKTKPNVAPVTQATNMSREQSLALLRSLPDFKDGVMAVPYYGPREQELQWVLNFIDCQFPSWLVKLWPLKHLRSEVVERQYWAAHNDRREAGL